ncbi:MAG TPA: fructose-1,6-bisphosphate aldolase/phosphatase [Gemmataceae bacterium]|nr:fructose-1,6-bisphosphate aldolase/phosphatase [Gemmataceae bacterium]
MNTTLSIIKADIGSIGGHVAPSRALMRAVDDVIVQERGGMISDYFIGATGDDIAILMVHNKGVGDEDIHHLAWTAFRTGTKTAQDQGLYGAGQDLLVDAFSGNVKGMGPAVAEMQIDARPNEPFLMFAADKTEPGAYNLPLYLAFADPMNTAGLLLSPEITKGYRFRIMDVNYTEGERVIELNAPEDLYDIAALLRDNDRFVVESIFSRHDNDQAAAVSTQRLHNIAGKYTGKDDPVMLVRVQKNFPATGEILAPYHIAHYVGGFMRGSHIGPLMPVKRNTGCSYFDGPPIVSCLGFCVKDGKLTEPMDLFEHPFWDTVRARAAEKAMEIRRQGFSGPAMLSYSELEYGGIVKILDRLEKRFVVREAREPAMA